MTAAEEQAFDEFNALNAETLDSEQSKALETKIPDSQT